MRIMSSKSKNSESFYITKSFIDRNGKSTSKIIRKLGTLSELSQMLLASGDLGHSASVNLGHFLFM